MPSELNNRETTSTLDVTGLPEPIVRSIQQLVDSLRGQVPSEATSARAPLRGRFANLKLSIPREDIDEAQRETWSAFPLS